MFKVFLRYWMLIEILLGATLGSIGVQATTVAMKDIAVQADGRVKPYDTLAREALAAIYGKSTYEKKPAYEVMFTIMLAPETWEKREIFEIQHSGVKEALRFTKEKRYFSIAEIMSSDRLPLLMQDLSARREAKDKLDPYFQALQRLENQIWTYKAITAGHWLAPWPPKEGTKWLALADADAGKQELFMKLTKSFLGALTDAESNGTATKEFQQAVADFKTAARAENLALYPEDSFLQLEVQYNELNPFRWAWGFYLVAVLFFIIGWAAKRPRFFMGVWLFTIIGWFFHSYGFGLRMYLTERPPVSNMFETVVWVSWGAVLFSMILEKFYRFGVTLLAGPIVATFCLILTDMAPTILDPTLQPLEPVLRSNFWLTVHVLTITISYSAFFVAFFLGDLGLYYVLRGEEQWTERIKTIVSGIYRSFQIGVVLLAAGIILGGVWADYSWGRFWGWDPKETWALIALLGYVAVLHGRINGMIRDYGMLVSAVITFSLVIMAWYGVNYVLGAGLHSYGFGAGGVEYVSAFIFVHLVYVAVVTILRRGRQKAAASR
jgi:cytochrome c-type biogenesis protein CcsB